MTIQRLTWGMSIGNCEVLSTRSPKVNLAREAKKAASRVSAFPATPRSAQRLSLFHGRAAMAHTRKKLGSVHKQNLTAASCAASNP